MAEYFPELKDGFKKLLAEAKGKKIAVAGHAVTPTSNRRAKSSLLSAAKTKKVTRPRGMPMTPIRRLPIPSIKV